MSKPHILFIVPLPPPVHGSAMMCQYIKDSRLINDTFHCDYVNLSTSRRMDEIGKRSVKKIFRFIGSYFSVLGKLFTHHYDACYLAITCHGMGFLKDAPFVVLCKLFGRKVVIHQHNKGMANDVDRWPYRWLLPLVYRNTTVILLSWKLYPDVEKVVKREQVMICPNGIPDIDQIPHRQPHAIPHLLFLSNLIESKGVIDLLDACKILKDKGYRFVCNFVGGETKDINAERFNAEVKKRGLDQTVCYLGSKYGESKMKQYADNDMLVFPTCNDCFPLVLLEAMQNKLPTVSTDVGGIPDIVSNGETGLICEKHFPNDLADKIEKLLDNPEIAIRMGEEGRKRFLENYTISKHEEVVNNALMKICISGGGNYVNYLGKKYGDEKSEILASSDIFVFPTCYPNECFPLVLLEAMQYEIPVVTTDEGGITDVVLDGVNGLICRKHDSKDLANKIGLLLDNPQVAFGMGWKGKNLFS